MLKMIVRFAALAIVAAAFAWFADRPGSLTADWLGYSIEAPLGLAVLALAVALLVLWGVGALLRRLFQTPGAMSDYFRVRRIRRGHEALSRGMVAVAAGDAETARRHAQLTSRLLAGDPLSRLLEAQTAQLEGDYGRVRQVFETMSRNPETELVALRGLYVQARHSGDEARARKLAERAHALNPGLGWASNAVLATHAAGQDWPAVLSILDAQRRAHLIDENTAKGKRAVVLAAQAIAAESVDATAALDLASKALKLEPGLVPAAVVAGRILIGQGSLRKASRLLERAWSLKPHPDLAEVYAHARPGDSPQDRLNRVRDLRRASDGGEEGAVALARASIDTRDWKLARETLISYAADRPRARVCALMAEIEEGEHGDLGRMREWLSRAVRAPRDPAWVADGLTSETWLPISPATGEIGAFEWKPPVEALGYTPAPPVGQVEEPTVAAPPLLEAAELVPSSPERAERSPIVEEAPKTAVAEVRENPPAAASEPRIEKDVAPIPLRVRQPDDPGPEAEPQPDASAGWARRLAGS